MVKWQSNGTRFGHLYSQFLRVSYQQRYCELSCESSFSDICNKYRTVRAGIEINMLKLSSWLHTLCLRTDFSFFDNVCLQNTESLSETENVC